jgi:purine-nucleoside phosphorylase
MPEELQESKDFLISKGIREAQVGMITGTGLGSLTEKITVERKIPYGEIPHFPKSTVAGHSGTLIHGRLAGKSILALEGRFHLYEGYRPSEIALPVRIMRMLGAEYLLISSAAGGLNPRFKRGDLMLITDHINLTGRNPLLGPNPDELGPRFPDMSRAYPADLAELVKKKALELGVPLREGVYLGLTGPSLETPAETRFLRIIGADAVGMSTVTEAIAAVHCGLRVMAIVVITNVNLPDCMQETSLEQVIAAADKAGFSLSALWENTVAGLP